MPVRSLPFVLWLLLAAGCVTQTARESAPQQSTRVDLPLRAGTIHVLADDLDGDGRDDLVFTSHGGNYSRAFFQREGRRFEPGPEQDVVGFHPNDVIRLPGPSRLYLSSGEGTQRLNVFRIDERGFFSLAADTVLPQPRAATPFQWPGWPRSLAVAPYDADSVYLLRNFDPETGDTQQNLLLKPHPRVQRPGTMVAADLDGDAIDELYFTITEVNELWRIRFPGNDAEPPPEKVFSFKDGIFASRFLALLDVDADGREDILVPQTTTGRLEVLLSDGSGGFAPGAPIGFPYREGPFSVAAAVDRDGGRLLAVGSDQVFALYRFSAGGEYSRIAFGMPKDYPSFIALEDLDGDGWLDIAAARGGRAGTPSGMVLFGPLWQAFESEAQRAPVAAGN